MLKLAKSVEYAIFALKYIAENPQSDCISTKEISEKMNIPYDLLAKILQRLVKDELIYSIQGTKGGYSLRVQPGDVSITRIINAVDQKIQLTDCMFHGATTNDCGRVETCCLRSPLSRIQDKINILFDNTTLMEII